MQKEVRAFAPASVSNVGCGFDIFGFALDNPGDEVVIRIVDKKALVIKNITGDNGEISKDIENNTAGIAVKSFVNEIGFDGGLEIEIDKKMGVGTGLGSSAASAVASVYALDCLLETKFDKHKLLRFAVEGEKLTSGGRTSADNVAACLFGGFIIVRSVDDLDVINIDYPEDLYCSILYPHILIRTSDMRKILKTEITLDDGVKQWGNIAALVAGLMKKDHELIGRSLQDYIIEPTRSILIPGFNEIKKMALENGALGSSISGSGPSMFALSRSRKTASDIVVAMQKITDKMGIQSDTYISRINRIGPRILSKNFK